MAGSYIVDLFQLSIDRPSDDTIGTTAAKIIPLRKPWKVDYSRAKACRPISFPFTLSKALESIVAEQIAFLAEERLLLPQNQFGGRKKRSTVQALAILQERIYEAWRKRKIPSLVSIDLKGAFNGVDKEVLTARLRERSIPAPLLR